ncbi:hypothetical protein E2P81_ATG05562 [Venturia nashicola]|nr:hypothetical protein E2P81_ATG05562 [Venturia nashicola]
MRFSTIVLSIATAATAAPVSTPQWSGPASEPAPVDQPSTLQRLASNIGSFLTGSITGKQPKPPPVQPAGPRTGDQPWTPPPYPNQPGQPQPYPYTNAPGSSQAQAQPWPSQPYPVQPGSNPPALSQPYPQGGQLPSTAKPTGNAPVYQNDKSGLTLSSPLGTYQYHKGPDGTYMKGGALGSIDKPAATGAASTASNGLLGSVSWGKRNVD